MDAMKSWRRRAQLVVIGAALLGGTGQASLLSSQSDTLGSQLAGMSGAGLTLAECQQRMEQLGTLLQGAGYRNVRTHVTDDGTLIARWYHTDRKMTALAFAGQQATGNTFSAGEHPGYLRWNEFSVLR